MIPFVPIQLNLLEESDPLLKFKIHQFSSQGICNESSRQRLEEKYLSIFQETDEYNRKLVSFQANKENITHNWFHYKEGFSSQLVESFIKKLNLKAGDTLLEPFSGSGTSLLVAKKLNINAIGFEILPLCSMIWEAKSTINNYPLDQLSFLYNLLQNQDPQPCHLNFPHLRITESAFSEQTENDLMFYTQWINSVEVSKPLKKLFSFILTSILEEISYTRKDGQCLRWDYRSPKIQKRNTENLNKGKSTAKLFNKGDLPSVKEALLKRFSRIIKDIYLLQNNHYDSHHSQQKLIVESALEALPQLSDNQFAGVITSPPYCNRYDYSRIYALELAYLGVNEQEIRRLRQSQLSSTVENKSKLDSLLTIYQSLNQTERFYSILDCINQNPIFQEINNALLQRWNRQEMNNKGVLTMVKQYFIELTFVIAEIFRTCRNQAYVVMVNDHVKYGGEIIPVDTLSTEIAETLGFIPVTIYVLPQLKGNSSQQMDKYGRTALRKSITIWQKP